MTEGQDVLSDRARELVAEAVRETLLALGVDVSSPEAVLAMQQDFAHLRAWRNASTELKDRAGLAAIGIFVTGTAAAIWLGFQQMIHGAAPPPLPPPP